MIQKWRRRLLISLGPAIDHEGDSLPVELRGLVS